MKHSRRSIIKFYEFVLGLDKPIHSFHQTLTFCPPCLDPIAAKEILKRLLESLKRKYGLAVIYSEERQRNGGIHYHAILMFFEGEALPCPPGHLEDKLRAYTFSTWSRLSGCDLAYCANRLKACVPDFDYLTKEGIGANGEGKLKRGDTHWWGCSNRELLLRHCTPPAQERLKRKIRDYFPRYRLPAHLRYTKRQLERDKKEYIYISLGDESEWEEYKCRNTGSKTPVTDDEYLAFKKRRALLHREEWKRQNTGQ